MYYRYGWRGIKFLWNSFEDFYNDMKDIYNDKVIIIWEKEISIERINNDWNYCRENCTFIPKILQNSNQKRHHTEQYKKRLEYANINNIDIHDRKLYYKYWKENIKQ